MASRFEEKPEETNLFTPEVAEKIVERFAERQAERQRVEAAERERLASMTRVQELADLLGTTTDEIESIAKEVRGPYVQKPTPVQPVSRFPVNEAKPTWPIHLAYLCAIAVIGVWAVKPATPTINGTVSPNQVFRLSDNPMHAPVTLLKFDPYIGGYSREMGAFMMNVGQVPTQIVKAPEVVSPPPGMQVSLVTPAGRKTTYGPMGPPMDSKAGVEKLQQTIRTLAAFEESLATVDPFLPTASNETAPWLQDHSSFQGQPKLVGWHDIELFSGGQLFHALVPDHRYAKDEALYQKTMQMRLDHITDTKFFPSQPPANLRSGAIEIHPAPALPRGTSIMIYNSQKTIWAQGMGDAADYEVVKGSLVEAFKLAKAKLASSMGKEDHLQVWFNYPSGEYSNNWPLDNAAGYGIGGAVQRQKEEIADMVTVFRKAVGERKPGPAMVLNP